MLPTDEESLSTARQEARSLGDQHRSGVREVPLLGRGPGHKLCPSKEASQAPGPEQLLWDVGGSRNGRAEKLCLKNWTRCASAVSLVQFPLFFALVKCF